MIEKFLIDIFFLLLEIMGNERADLSDGRLEVYRHDIFQLPVFFTDLVIKPVYLKSTAKQIASIGILFGIKREGNCLGYVAHGELTSGLVLAIFLFNFGGFEMDIRILFNIKVLLAFHILIP